MRRRTRSALTAGLLLAATLGGTAPSSAADGPVLTRRPPQLVALVDGVEIRPLLSAGDVVGTGNEAYQMTGVPDGIGVYRSSPTSVEVYMNHELDGDPSNARVSHLTLDDTGAVVAAEYAIDGSEGYHDFCSSTLTVLDGVPWYFTGEEENSARYGGTSIAINARTGRVFQTPWFGHLAHEQVLPVPGLAQAAVFTGEDGAHEHAQIFVYTADTFADAIHGRGTLRTWCRPAPPMGRLAERHLEGRDARGDSSPSRSRRTRPSPS
jgi:hypothetical protein